MASHLFTKNFYTRFFASLSDFKSCARSCPVCELILSTLRDADSSLLDHANEFESNTGTAYRADGGTDIEGSRGRKVNITLRIELTTNSLDLNIDESQYTHLKMAAVFLFGKKRGGYQEDSRRWIETSVAALQPEGSKPDTTYSYLGPDIRLDGNQKIKCMLAWLCMSRTQKCPIQQDGLPRRLLDVTDPTIVRLVQVDQMTTMETLSQPLEIRYTALSHRWGTSQHMVATLASLESLKKGVPVAQLPQTFQDAVSLSQQLGISYLWIDALCIIQDSPDDWLRESEKMGSIFQNSVVTIAAHCASDDSEGFLKKALSKSEKVLCGEHMAFSKLPNHDRDITNSRLSKRGWVLQERLMSSRTIHLTSGQVYFEDEIGITDENDMLLEYEGQDNYLTPSYQDYLDMETPIVDKLRQMLMLDSSEGDPGPSHLLQGPRALVNWLHLVELFSRCELTKESDKLIAMTGMARHIQAKIGQDWCAGIWKDFICHGLLWFSTKDGLTKPTHARAPSWSWAAWDGAVQYPIDVGKGCLTPSCHFVSLKDSRGTKVNWLNATGSLTVKGSLVELQDVYFGDSIQVGPGPARRGVISESVPGLPLMKVKDLAHAFWIRNIGGDRLGWIVFDSVDAHFIRQHSIPGNFDAKDRMDKYGEQFRPKSIFVLGEEHYFLVLGTLSTPGAASISLQSKVDIAPSNLDEKKKKKKNEPQKASPSNKILSFFSRQTRRRRKKNTTLSKLFPKSSQTDSSQTDSSQTDSSEDDDDDLSKPTSSNTTRKNLDFGTLTSPSCSTIIKKINTDTYFGIYLIQSPDTKKGFKRVGFGQITSMPMETRQVTLV